MEASKTFKCHEETKNKINDIIKKSGLSDVEFFEKMVKNQEELEKKEQTEIYPELNDHVQRELLILKDQLSFIEHSFINIVDFFKHNLLKYEQNFQLEWHEKEQLSLLALEEMKQTVHKEKEEVFKLYQDKEKLINENASLAERYDRVQEKCDVLEKDYRRLSEHVVYIEKQLASKQEEVLAYKTAHQKIEDLEKENKLLTDEVKERLSENQRIVAEKAKELEFVKQMAELEVEKRLMKLELEQQRKDKERIARVGKIKVKKTCADPNNVKQNPEV